MKTTQAQLLESLGGGVRPIDAVDPGQVWSQQSFDALLDDAISGKPQTDLPIKFAPSLSGIYSAEEQQLIARGVDRAASSGVDHALILHNKRTLRVDVRNRIVLDAYPITSDDVVNDIDGFLTVQTISDDEDTPGTMPDSQALKTPARVVRNASLVHALSDGQIQ